MNKFFKGSALAAMALCAMSANAGDTGFLQPVSVNPVDGSSIAPNTEITIKFDEELDEMSMDFMLSGLWTCIEEPGWTSEAYPYISFEDPKALVFQAPSEWDNVVLGNTYKFNLPEGFIKGVSGKGNASIDLIYTIDYTEVVVNVWTDSGEYSSLQNPFSVSVQPTEGLELSTSKNITLAHGGKTYNGVVSDAGWCYEVKFEELPGEIVEPGEYVLTIPAGYFTCGTLTNKEIVNRYTVLEPQFLPDPTITPAAGSEVSLGTKVVFDYGVDVYPNYNAKATIYNKTRDITNEVDLDLEESYKAVSIRIIGNGYEDGDVIECSLPQRAVYYNDGMIEQQSKAVSVTYTFKVVEAGTFAPLSITPETVSGDPQETGLGLFNLNIADEYCPVLIPADAAEQIVFRCITTGEVYPIGEVSFNDWSKNIVIMTEMFSETYQYIYDNGTYELYIPAGLFVAVTGATSEEYRHEWTIGGEVTELEVKSTNPVNGATVQNFNNFTITFGAPVTVAEGATATITGPMLAEVIAPIAVSENDPKSVVITLDETLAQEGEYTIMVPAGVITAGALSNAALTYTLNVSADTSLKLLSITPSNEQPLSVINEGDTWTVAINRAAEVGYIEGHWTSPGNPNDSFVDCVLRMQKNDEGLFTWTNQAWPFYFYKGYDYTLTLTCKSFDDSNSAETAEVIGTLAVVYEGGNEDTVTVNNTAFASVDPVCGTVLTADNNVVTFKFNEAVDFVSGFATVGGQGAMPCTVEAEADVLKQEWKVTVPGNWLANIAGSFALNVFFQDEYGKPVVLAEDQKVGGELGMDDAYGLNYATDKSEIGISVMYMCLEGAVALDITPEEGDVESLKTFVVTNPDAATLNILRWSYQIEKSDIKLYNEKDEVVAVCEEVTDAEDNKSVTLVLDKEITADGTYTLVCPWNAFTLGEEFNGGAAKELRVTYKIGDDSVEGIFAEGAAANIYSINGVCVKRNASADDLRGLAKGIYVINGKKVVVK